MFRNSLQTAFAGSRYTPGPMKTVIRLFSDHPTSVGETYAEHASYAAGFGFRMVLGGLACMIHAIFPFLFVKTASSCVRELHGRISTGPRAGLTSVPPGARPANAP